MFSPRLSIVTLMPARLTACVPRTASAISVPATKRPDTRRPIEDCSAKLRRERFSERRTKNVLSMDYLPVPEASVPKDEKRSTRRPHEDPRRLYHKRAVRQAGHPSPGHPSNLAVPHAALTCRVLPGIS